MRVRMALMGCLSGLGLAVCSAPAEAAGPVQLRVAKHAEGPFVNRQPFVTVADKPRNLYWRITNRTNHNQDVLVGDDSFGTGLSDFKIRWFRGAEEITEEAQGIGSAFSLRPDRPKIIRARVKALVPDPGEFCLRADFNVAPDSYEIGGTVYVNDRGACG